jgi:hypothetical protein
MIAAKVTCLCRQMRLSALSLDLKQGESGWVPEAKARVSRELQHYERRGALKVEYLEKVDEMSRQYPKWPRGAKVLPQRPGIPSPPATRAALPGAILEESEVHSAGAPAAPAVMDPSFLEVQRALLAEVRLLRAAVEQRPASAPVTVSRSKDETKALRSLLEEIQGMRTVMEGLKGAISALAAHQRNLPATMLGAIQAFSAKMIHQAEVAESIASNWDLPDDEEPVFVPSGLVDSSKSVSVASQESATGGLEDSAAQLRALKGKGKSSA